jgi:hypothetical protein
MDSRPFFGTAEFPKDASAWWAFAGSSLGGLALVLVRAPQRLAESLFLLLAFSCLFGASDWISSLSGKSLGGDIPTRHFWPSASPLVLTAGVAALAWFCRLEAPRDLNFWLLALASGASVTVLMFLLRLDLAPHDSRLLALSSLLCTLPALYLAFLAFGGPYLQAWIFWLLPAIYFPVSSVFAWTWLQGLYGSKTHLTLLAAPILILVLLALGWGADLDALVLLAYLAYLVGRLLARYQQGSQRLPEFSAIRHLGREQSSWNLLVVMAWCLNGVAR